MSQQETLDMAARIAVERTNEHFCAHTLYSQPVDFQPGDRVWVDGPIVAAETGDRFITKRRARVRRAGALVRFWVRLISVLEITGLYEVSFSGRQKP